MKIIRTFIWVIRFALFWVFWVISVPIMLMWAPLKGLRLFDIVFKVLSTILMGIMQILLPSSKKHAK